MKSFMRETRNILSKNQRFNMNQINEIIDQFRLGNISLDEMWYQIDKLLDLQDLKPTLPVRTGHITKFKVNWHNLKLG